MNNPIYIIGAGAIGTTLAILLQNHGRNVVLIRGRSSENSRASVTTTVQLPSGEEVQGSLHVTCLRDYAHLDGTIVITAKSYGNKDLASALHHKTGNAAVVLLQNGLGVEEPFLRKSFNAVMRCVLFVSSQYSSANTIRFKPVNPSAIGMIEGDNNLLSRVVEELSSPVFPFIQEPDIQPVIWKKAIINCVFNSICPLLETDMGIFHRENEVLQMGKEVIREALIIAANKGIHIEEKAIVDQLLKISRASPGQLISTMQDILEKRRTEIDTLNLAIAKMGQDLGKQDIVQQNTLLGKLVWWKSALHRM